MALEALAPLSTYTVTSTADDGSSGTLRWAIGQANADGQADAIDFSSQFATPQTITLQTGQLVLTDRATITITGPGADLLTVNGDGKSRVFELDGGSAAISGLTVAGGAADQAGGVYDKGGTLTLTDCILTGNSATNAFSGDGGGLYINGGSAALTGCSISGNTAANGGGLFLNGGSATLTDCTIGGNYALERGGGVFGAGNLALTNCTVSGNTAGGGGGGGLLNGGTATLINCTVSRNDADASYGGGGARRLRHAHPDQHDRRRPDVRHRHRGQWHRLG